MGRGGWSGEDVGKGRGLERKDRERCKDNRRGTRTKEREGESRRERESAREKMGNEESVREKMGMRRA